MREGRGRFIPKQDVQGGAALDLFVVGVPEPAGALTEYNRLTGRPVMPPKWTLGYFQSHRTLAGPEEPLQIARAFREKSLPCDAMIYLGTGYCTNGWNQGHGSLEFNPNLEPDERMKQWPGGVRLFAVDLVGSDAKPKLVEFRGARVSVSF